MHVDINVQQQVENLEFSISMCQLTWISSHIPS